MRAREVIQYLFATPQRKDDKLNMRLWFVLYVLYMVVVTVVTQYAFVRYSDTYQPSAKTIWYLGLYMLYLSLACTYIPLNTGILVLLLASPDGGLTAISPFWRVMAVAGLGALATAISHLNEYHLITYLLRLGRAYKIKQTRIYLWAERHFSRWPFVLLVIFNVLPLPADPIRWLAIISQYSLTKYFLAQWVGRFIRYAILATVAKSLKLTFVQIIIICTALFVISGLIALVQRFRQRGVESNVAEKASA